MNPDLFITIAFCFYVSLVVGAGAVVLVMVSHERRTDASPKLQGLNATGAFLGKR